MSERKTVVAAIPDLFFGSKVSATAKAIGVEVKFAQTQKALLRNARQTPSLLVVDLGAAALDPIGSIEAIRSDEATKDLTVVAFANHEREDLMAAARGAGCSDVMTRGAFAAALPQLLGSL